MLKLLLPLDGSELSERAVAHAMAIARSLPCNVTLLRVVTPAEYSTNDSFSRVDWRLHRYQAQTYLDNIAKSFLAAGATCDIRVKEGRPAETIIDVAREIGSTLLVMSTHGRGAATDFPHGSVASKLLSAVEISVLLVGARNVETTRSAVDYKRLLAVIDGSPQSECTLRSAAAFAQHMEASLYVICVAKSIEVPPALNGDRKAQALCNEVNVLLQRTVRRRLTELRATLSNSLAPKTSILVSSVHDQPFAEVAQLYDPDLILTSIDCIPGGNQQIGTVTAMIGRAPLLVLSPKGIGAAICDISRDDVSGVPRADAS